MKIQKNKVNFSASWGIFSLREGSKGWRSGHQCGPGSNPIIDAICGLSFFLVLSFAPRGFSLGTLVFPSPQKPMFGEPNILFQFAQESGRRRTTMWTCYLLIIIYVIHKRNHNAYPRDDCICNGKSSPCEKDRANPL